MSDAHGPEKGGPPQQFDREISLRGIGLFGLWLTIGVVVVLFLMYGLYRAFERQEAKQDRPISPLVDRTQRRLPPEPRLQTTPEIDLQAYRADQMRGLESWGWVDEKAGVAHLPIERAIDMVLEKGLPSRGALPLAAPEGDAAAPDDAPVPRAAGGHR